MKKKLTALLLSVCMLIAIFPITALAREVSNATLTVSINVRAYNPNTQKHERFYNLNVSTTVKVEEGSNPEYPVTYRFEKETYWGSTSSPYYGEEGWKLIVTIGDIELDTANAWVFDRDMSGVFGTGQTFKPMYAPSGSASFSNTLYIWDTGTPLPQPVPDKPSEDDLPAILSEKAVTVDCIAESASHPNETYVLLPNGYVIGNVAGDETSGYTCNITVQPDLYVQAYNGVHGDHTLDPAGQTSKTIILKWDTDNERWTVPEDSIPVIFTVKCTTTPPPADPAIRGFTKERLTSIPDDITWIDGFDKNSINTDANVVIPNGDSVTLLYKLTITGDEGANFVVTDEGATLVGSNCGAVQDAETGKISGTIPAESTSVNIYVTKTFTASDIRNDTLTNSASVAPGENTELGNDVGNAEASTPAEGESPTKPTAPDEDALLTLLGDGVVKVDCEASGVSHVNKTYGLIQGSYVLGTVTGDGDTGYIYTLTINSEEYVAQYNDDVGAAHTLHTDNQAAEIILTWNAETNEWELATNLPIIFAVTE